MYPGLMGEGVVADDGLVGLDLDAGDRRDEPARVVYLRRVYAAGDAEEVRAGPEAHHDFLERRVARPLPEPVDSAFYLPGARGQRREGVATARPRSLWQWTEIMALSMFGTLSLTPRISAANSSGAE